MDVSIIRSLNVTMPHELTYFQHITSRHCEPGAEGVTQNMRSELFKTGTPKPATIFSVPAPPVAVRKNQILFGLILCKMFQRPLGLDIKWHSSLFELSSLAFAVDRNSVRIQFGFFGGDIFGDPQAGVNDENAMPGELHSVLSVTPRHTPGLRHTSAGPQKLCKIVTGQKSVSRFRLRWQLNFFGPEGMVREILFIVSVGHCRRYIIENFPNCRRLRAGFAFVIYIPGDSSSGEFVNSFEASEFAELNKSLNGDLNSFLMLFFPLILFEEFVPGDNRFSYAGSELGSLFFSLILNSESQGPVKLCLLFTPDELAAALFLALVRAVSDGYVPLDTIPAAWDESDRRHRFLLDNYTIYAHNVNGFFGELWLMVYNSFSNMALQSSPNRI